jgi:hypothetical protein
MPCCIFKEGCCKGYYIPFFPYLLFKKSSPDLPDSASESKEDELLSSPALTCSAPSVKKPALTQGSVKTPQVGVRSVKALSHSKCVFSHHVFFGTDNEVQITLSCQIQCT